MAIYTPIEVYKGTDVYIRLQMVTPEDISGWTLYFTVRKTPDGNPLIVKHTNNGDIDMSDGMQGGALLRLRPADTASIAEGYYLWDVKRMDVDHKTIYATGSILLLDTITN